MEKASLSIDKRALVKRFLSVFIPIVCVVMLVSWLIYYFQHIKTQQEILLAQEANMTQMQNEFVLYTIKSIISDLNIIASDPDFKPRAVLKNKSRDAVVNDEVVSFSKYKGIYDQVRFIDETGMEVIRVDLRQSSPVVVPEDQLQFKKERYYFKDTFRLGPGEIFMSPLDLNIEQGKIELPLKPMIRFGMVIFDSDNEKQGVLILNYLAEELIQNLERLTFRSPGHLMLLNADGFYLKGMQPEDEWGFMFEDRYDKTIGNQYPDIWQAIIKNETGQVLNHNGLFTFSRVYPLKSGIKSSSGSPKPFADSVRDLGPNEYFWVIVSHIFPGDLHRKDSNFLYMLVFSDLVFLLLLGGVTWEMMVAKARKKLAEDELKRTNQALEATIRKRTRELSEANTSLKKEIEDHHRAIDEKLKIKSQLQQAQKMEAIGTLAGGIAHDFNNILTPIIGYAEMVLMQLDNDSPLRADVKEIISASGRARDLVGQILAFGRRSKKELKPIRVQDVVKDALKLLRASIPTTIEIRNKINSECRAILADPIQIHQIIMNLCTNAYHAMREKGGLLTVTLDQTEIGPADYQIHYYLEPGTHIKLTVSDTGPGIPPELQKKIFEPYFTTKGKGEGTGLGLAVAHGIIKDLKGHISVYSEPGQGTAFVIYLPVAESVIAVSGETPYAAKRYHGTETVLIVDDEETILRFEKRILEDLGYKVTALTDSEEALAVFTRNPDSFDLVISDMTMPKMTGIDLIRRMFHKRPGIPAILCTGFSESVNAEKAAELGIKGYIAKPVILKEFSMKVREVLDQEKEL